MSTTSSAPPPRTGRQVRGFRSRTRSTSTRNITRSTRSREAGMRNIGIAQPPESGSEEGYAQFISATGQISVADVAPTDWFDPMRSRYYNGETTIETIDGVDVRVTQPLPGDNLGFVRGVEVGWACDDFVWILEPPFNGDERRDDRGGNCGRRHGGVPGRLSTAAASRPRSLRPEAVPGSSVRDAARSRGAPCVGQRRPSPRCRPPTPTLRRRRATPRRRAPR